MCALVLGEGEFAQVPPDLVAEDWRRAFQRRHLQQLQKSLKEKLARDTESQTLLAQKQEIDWQLEALKTPPSTRGENG